MKSEEMLKYYIEHGLVTSPGPYKNLMENLPKEVIEICGKIHEFMLIDLLPNMGVTSIPNDNLKDVNIRGIEYKLKEVIDRGNSELLNSRKHDKLLLGNCRDTSLMLCSILRNNGIPARVRSGFATFFIPGKYLDHWICEYWNDLEDRWIKVDTWMSQIHHRKEMLPIELFKGLLDLNYDSYDVKSEYFITGGEAWLNCRENGHIPEDYGTYEEHLKGLWFVRDNMIRDILCLNKLEPLPWDCWGFMGIENNNIEDEKLRLLDDLARFLIKEDFTKNMLQERLGYLELKDSVIKSLSQ